MDATPRLRSAFPATPRRDRRDPRRSNGFEQSPAPQKSIPSLPTITKAPPSSAQPLIPESYIDAPSQRLYAVALWVALWTWRIYDYTGLQESDEQSLWLFMKWVAIDGIFLFGLPGFRIPWLEWASSTMTLIFLAHGFVDAMLMFRIPIPIGAGLAVLWRGIWGYYETAVNEHNINPDTIRYNDSLILGRQIIHILPEGSAILNPNRDAFCIDPSQGITDIKLPIMINATNPIAMEIQRYDLDGKSEEKLSISKSQIKTMHKEASRLLSYSENPHEPKTLYYHVKKPGVYVLSKVVDETNLEVSRKRNADTVIVPCPEAAVRPSPADKCRGELSDVELEITGTPPLKVKYRKRVNDKTLEAGYDNIQPDDLMSPLSKRSQSALAVPDKVNVSWAQPQTMQVPLSESLGAPGRWTYAIDEVTDGFGNVRKYSHDSGEQKRSSKSASQHHVVTVHERPVVHMKGCSAQKPLKVAKGQLTKLPLGYGSTVQGELANTAHHIEYLFSPASDMSANGEHSKSPERKTITVRNPKQVPEIRDAGLYTVTGVSTDFCSGDVLEPASCLLQNPPEPSLAISEQEVFDKCAGSPIGLQVDLDLIGTPPFEIRYRMTREGERHHQDEVETINGMRGQLELTPKQAGKYTYDFVSVSDSVYQHQPLKGLQLKQAVKPSANARFVSNVRQTTCIDEEVELEVAMSGEPPFQIEYELVHGTKRAKHVEKNLTLDRFPLKTGILRDGGDYTVALISIVDGNGCREFLNEEAKLTVRHQKPKVGFGQIEGKRSVDTLEGKRVSIPIRLSGGGPWTIRYQDANKQEHTFRTNNPNDKIDVTDRGVVELVGVNDDVCPGTVDELARDFAIGWVDRPQMRIADTDFKSYDKNVLVKNDVCEGDDDVVDILFKGAPPYEVSFEQTSKLEHGAVAPRKKELNSQSHSASVRMDTSQAGLHEYRFATLGDANYKHSPGHLPPLKVQQRVHARPSAAFKNAGKTYGFCSVESDGEEVIPVILHGQAPFQLEVEIKHHGTAKPELVPFTINSNTYNIRIPHSRLHAGKSAISLRRVSDARDCSRSLDSSTPRVQISVHDAPSVTALETQEHYCVGDRLSFGLAGVAPFQVSYTFNGASNKATVSSGSTFRRLAEKPGTFIINGLQDSASACKATTHIEKHIHGMPSVRISQGRESYVDIHEGGQVEILFEFGGVPPFEFTYTRSSNTEKGGKKGVVLDMRSEVSEEHSLRIWASQEGTYEVVAIKDAHCSYSKPGSKADPKAPKRLGY